MNWIWLIIAGLFEVAFAFCLGKVKESTGNEVYLWYAGFIMALIISMGLLMKAIESLLLLQLMLFGQASVLLEQYFWESLFLKCYFLASIFYQYFNWLYYWIENGVALVSNIEYQKHL
jgi:hypothetical protein